MQMVAHRHLASKIVSMIAASAMLITGFAVVGNASASSESSSESSILNLAI